MPAKIIEHNSKLSSFRTQIDALDDQIMDLLLQRIKIVQQVGNHKKNEHLQSVGERNGNGQKPNAMPCPIRSGREAEMLRRIIEKFSKTDFPATAAADIWRIIIGASTGLEADMTLSVYTAENEPHLYWLAREYFGSSLPIIKQPNVKRVVGDVVDGKAAVGIAPFPRGADANPWWVVLLQQGENAPKIFAHVPFVYDDTQNRSAPAALAFAKLTPEPSGDDRSLLVVEADANVSQSRLQTAFQSAKLDVTWLDIAAILPDSRHHFLEIKGFITPEHAEFASVISSLGASVFRCSFLGAYATPIAIDKNGK